MFDFKIIDPSNFKDACELIESNIFYNSLLNQTKTNEDLKEELMNEETTSLLVYKDSLPIAVIDLLPKHPKNHLPMIGLFLIHYNYQHLGIGTSLYDTFEKQYLKEVPAVTLAVLKRNTPALNFWKKQGYTFEREAISNDNEEVFVFRKELLI